MIFAKAEYLRRVATLAFAMLFTAFLSGCGEETSEEVEAALAEDVEVWRFAIEETAGGVQHAYAERFKELIEERTDGDVRVTIYTYGTLGTSDHVTELLRMGSVHFAMASPGHIGTVIPEVQALLLHFVFSDDPLVNKRALQEAGELRNTLNELYDAKGFQLLSIYQEGWMAWTADREIRTPDDFQGLRIRVMTTPTLLAAYQAYGAAPTPMAYGEVYSGLQLGQIDAQVNPLFAIRDMSFYEVNDYLIMGRHAPFITTAMTNRDFMEGLSADRRELVTQTVDELHDYIFDMQQQFNQEALEDIRENRPELNIVASLTDEERQAFREASLGVRQWYIDTVGPTGEQVLNQLLAAVEAAEQE
ncbi:MAG: TRAP transporter substrate-binding protein DctP [Phycisphaeraceae bacterium]